MINALILVAILIPLCYVLYYFGFLVTRAGFAIFRASYSLPARWEGKISETTGFMRRNFVIFRKYTSLSFEAETTSGAIELELKEPNGSLLSPASGAYGRNVSISFDVSQLKRCSATLRMDHFSGTFCIALQ